MPDFDTQSEQDFADFCRRQGWGVDKLQVAEEEGVRTPDFRVTTRTGYQFIAEVTEFDPAPPLKLGEIRVRNLTLGNALRDKLHEKKGQVKAYADDLPTLIVVSSGLDFRTELDPTAFDSALYGDLALGVTVPNDPRQDSQFDDYMHNAGRRFFGKDYNTSVSAAAALNGRPQILRVYHNRFAKTRLEPANLSIGAQYVEHFEKPDNGEVGWVRVLANQT